MQRLEKLNSSIDIIPLQSSTVGMERRQQQPGSMSKPVDKNRVDDSRVFRDPMIISRVRTYLYENEDKVYIDVTEMADCLQRKYRDYRGKKRGPFRSMVRQAYHEIRESIAKQTDAQWPEDDDDEIDIEIDAMQCNPHMPAEYLQAYKQQRAIGGRQNGNSSDKELIDISSDDEGAAKNYPIATTSADKDSMEVEQVKKRPHLSPSIEPHRSVTQQSQEILKDSFKDARNRNEKSRKRPREKENEIPFDLAIKKKAKDLPVVNPSVTFSDIGGSSKVLETVANLLLHLKHPEIYTKLGISPPRGFLLHGPPGCGKTLLAHAIAGELQLPLLKVAAPELVAGVSGESEQRIRELFEQAVAIAPCILFLDEIDAVAPHRATAQKEMERRIVSQLLSCLDELSLKENGSKVLVIGATNRPDSIDPALRRAGRFDREVSLGIPDKEAREAILRVHTAKVTLSSAVSLKHIAALTPGFVGADLVALIREAAMAAVNRTFEDLKSKVVNNQILDESPSVNSNTIENKVDESIIECTTEKTDKVSENTKEPIAKVDNVVNDEDKKEDKEDAVMTNENEKKSEQFIQSDSSKAETETPIAESPTSPTPATEKPQIEEQPESSKVSEPETAEVSIASPKDAPSKETPPTTITQDPPSVDNMQVEETNGRKDNIEPLKLDEMLAWLHNEPPLTNEQLALLCVEERDFDTALQNVQPSAKREGFATVPDVTWNDIGSLQDIRQELQMTILAPIRHSEQFESLGLNTPTGVLLCGPPGCGKTLLAKAIANEAGINFISVKGPELLNMYVGESEKAVRQCFMRARNSAPCVIFFDELDALCPKRSEGDSTATSRVVNQMLTEMDGVEGRKGVFLMAASNRPDIIDPAVLRPGRLDKILYVGLPNAVDREDILRALTKNGNKPKLAVDVNLCLIANSERCEGYTGADLAALIREAGVETLREIMNGIPIPAEICARHLDAAFDKIRPSVQEKDIKHYEKLKKLYSVKRSQNMDIAMTLESPSDSIIEAMET